MSILCRPRLITRWISSAAAVKCDAAGNPSDSTRRSFGPNVSKTAMECVKWSEPAVSRGAGFARIAYNWGALRCNISSVQGACPKMTLFGPFRLDTVNHCLWRADARVALTPKAFDVLRYLVERANRVVTQDEILEALWPETYVNP